MSIKRTKKKKKKEKESLLTNKLEPKISYSLIKKIIYIYANLFHQVHPQRTVFYIAYHVIKFCRFEAILHPKNSIGFSQIGVCLKSTS